MERPRFGRRNEGFTRKLGRFVEERVLEVDIIDTVLVATVLGTAYILKDYFERRRVRLQNNLARAVENRNIAPLNPNLVKEIGHIVSSKS